MPTTNQKYTVNCNFQLNMLMPFYSFLSCSDSQWQAFLQLYAAPSTATPLLGNIVIFATLWTLIIASLYLTFHSRSLPVHKVLGLLLLSIFVVFLWVFETSFLFIYLVYILAFIGAVLMLFLSVVLMLPISTKRDRSTAHPKLNRSMLIILAADVAKLRPPGMSESSSNTVWYPELSWDLLFDPILYYSVVFAIVAWSFIYRWLTVGDFLLSTSNITQACRYVVASWHSLHSEWRVWLDHEITQYLRICSEKGEYYQRRSIAAQPELGKIGVPFIWYAMKDGAEAGCGWDCYPAGNRFAKWFGVGRWHPSCKLVNRFSPSFNQLLVRFGFDKTNKDGTEERLVFNYTNRIIFIKAFILYVLALFLTNILPERGQQVGIHTGQLIWSVYQSAIGLVLAKDSLELMIQTFLYSVIFAAAWPTIVGHKYPNHTFMPVDELFTAETDGGLSNIKFLLYEHSGLFLLLSTVVLLVALIGAAVMTRNKR